MSYHEGPTPEKLAALSASSRYFDLDPRATPTETSRTLKELLPPISLVDISSYDLLAGSIAIEAAVGVHSNKERKNLLRKANGLLDRFLSKGADIASDRVTEGRRLRLLSDGLMVRKFAGGLYPEGVHKQLVSLMQQLVEIEPPKDDVQDGLRSKTVGMITEQVIMYLLSDESSGTVAVPSMARHEHRNVVDGKNYSWDLTVESDGLRVPTGQYRAQVKTASVERVLRGYHPEILIINASEHLGDNWDGGHSLTAATSIVERDTAMVDSYRDRLFDLLSNSTPASEELYYLT